MDLQQTADFRLDTKAVIREEDGDLFIEGFASDFDEDRDGEAFEPGAFDAGVKTFLEQNPVLLYHHDFGKALGQVETLEKRPGGLWMRARIDKPAGGWASDVYEKIRKGTIRGLSVGGKFYRRMTEKGPRIFNVDLIEVSVTPTPANPRTLFAVAGKSFAGQPDPIAEADLKRISDALDRVDATFDRLLAQAN